MSEFATSGGVKVDPKQKSDFGQVVTARFTVTRSLPCEIVLRGNYDNPGIAVELINVRRLGRHQGRIATEQSSHAVDDLAR